MKDYYALLEISREASDKEVKIAYRKKIRRYHPDVNKDVEAEKVAKLINQAYHILSDPVKRQEYDLQFFVFTPPSPDYTRATPQEVWVNVSNVYTEAQRQQENLRRNSGTWTFRGAYANSRTRRVRVQTSEGYWDIEFQF